MRVRRGEFPLGQFLGSETEEKGGAGTKVPVFRGLSVHGAETAPRRGAHKRRRSCASIRSQVERRRRDG